MHALLTLDGLVALATLTALEIVLGVDNLVFISLLSGRLPPERQPMARRVGLGLALLTRVALLFAISWIMGLTAPLFGVFGHAVSGRDLLLLAGGVFLMFKATREIYERVESGGHEPTPARRGRGALAVVLVQIMLFDVIFSLDSIMTAVGMADELVIMVVAVMIAVGVMMVSMETVNGFIQRHPSLKVLALSFLLLIGVMLVAEGSGRHVEKGYIYFAMAFSLFVEFLNMRRRHHRRRRVRPAAA